jgi:hypothetical protein
MNQILNLAMSLIRSPYLIRLTDRTFQSLIGAAFAAIAAAFAIWQTPGVPVGDKVNLTMVAIAAIGAVIAAWNDGNQKKDAAIAKAAIEAMAMQERPLNEAVEPHITDVPLLGTKVDLGDIDLEEIGKQAAKTAILQALNQHR